MTGGPGAGALTPPADPPCPAGLAPAPFTDRPSGPAGEAVDCLWSHGVTVGDGAGLFWPGQGIRRDQMATFVVRSLTIQWPEVVSLPTTNPFADVPADNVHAHSIALVHALGVTLGVSADRFAPSGLVTRGQMAVFLTRAATAAGVTVPVASPAPFSDVDPTTEQGRAVAALTALGVVTGYGDGTYGPGRAVTRAQMAMLVARSLTVGLLARPAGAASEGTGSVLYGVSVPGAPHDTSQLDAFEQAVATPAGLVMWFEGWAYGGFDAAGVTQVAARGSVPMITWEPWDYRRGIDQPAYSLASIIAGDHDAYVREWARAAAQWGGRLLLRWGHEMNAAHYPWSEQTNGNRAGQYAAAWRHLHHLFEDAGADNVEWVWSPNVSYQGTTPLAHLYPGDAYVDWVALDGYNGGSALDWGGWLGFEQLFGPSLAELATVTTAKPVMIGETASAEAGGDKAAWIRDFFTAVERRGIAAFVWFNHNKETDWRIQSSPAATAAFAAEVADPRYR